MIWFTVTMLTVSAFIRLRRRSMCATPICAADCAEPMPRLTETASSDEPTPSTIRRRRHIVRLGRMRRRRRDMAMVGTVAEAMAPRLREPSWTHGPRKRCTVRA